MGRNAYRSVSAVALVLLGWTVQGCVSGDAAVSVSVSGENATAALATTTDNIATYITSHYDKQQHRIPMRDGVTLFTTVYSPKDRTQTYPFMLFRTPYSTRPYEPDVLPRGRLGCSEKMVREGFIFVHQDVRGRYMSEGDFVNMRPHKDVKNSPSDIDESSDTYDTIEWLLQNVENHNGKVGMWGISYPGFYAAAGMIDAHPALKAVSPQAPIADWYFDDFHHHGAVFLPHGFNFFVSFGKARPGLTMEGWQRFDHGTPDGYAFFLEKTHRELEEEYMKGEIAFWQDAMQHPNYDAFWQERNILPHLKNVAPAVMTVGGWFDAEDLYGPLKIYRNVEAKNPGVFNILVMGPWAHGGWARGDGDRLGNIAFEAKHSLYYREHVELVFFKHFLKGEGDMTLPEAVVFETGANRWHMMDAWPPENMTERSLYFSEEGGLSFDDTVSQDGTVAFDAYVSDPNKPVPYTEEIVTGMTRAYMVDDQRFAGRRPDVLVYQTEPLEHDVTLAGPILADLWCSTSGTDSDWVVKLIDVFPQDEPNPKGIKPTRPYGGYQMMVRSEVIRGRYRNSYEHPEPFVPNEPTLVQLPLQDCLHTFKAGHRIMVQVQSTWFPLVDRNPQTYVDNIFDAKHEDYIKATQRIYRSGPYRSRLRVGVVDWPVLRN